MKALLIGEEKYLLRSLAFARKILKAKERFLYFLSREEHERCAKAQFLKGYDPLLEKETRRKGTIFLNDVSFGMKEADVLIFCSPFWREEYFSCLAENKIVIFRGLLLPGTSDEIAKRWKERHSSFYYIPSFSRAGFEVLEEEDPSIFLAGKLDVPYDEFLEKITRPLLQKGVNVISLPYKEAEAYRLSAEAYYCKKNEFALRIRKIGKRDDFNGDIVAKNIGYTPFMSRIGIEFCLYPRGEEGIFALQWLEGDKYPAEKEENLQFFLSYYSSLLEKAPSPITLLGVGEEASIIREDALSMAKFFHEKGYEVRAYDAIEKNARSFKKQLSFVRVFLKKDEAVENALPLRIVNRQ